ncbi:hypothetical protein BJ983_000538 [Actinomycetospora corticicola]|uniref:Uncharacterized protein n=1 Tax=Actinomycetospora corticicola TaxID=663602 RepID=A0A7Y9DS07_9PSEU|nr:hypothetical protein [Actinomycetospora corticicola]
MHAGPAAEVRGQRLEPVGPPGEQRDGRPLGRERPGGRLADPARRARDRRDPAVQW